MQIAIKESVGRGGKNVAPDVVIVQRLLNDKYLKPNKLPLLVDDGKAGTNTQNAIDAFQKKVVGLLNPDGRIDPGGASWRKLTAAVAVVPVVIEPFKQLPRSGSGYYTYSGGANQWGTKKTIDSITKLASSLKSIHKLEIAIGDISLEKGGKMPKHDSHKRGVDVDIRPIRLDRKRDPVTYKDKQYDRESTKKIVELLKRDSNLKKILFNDSKITGVESYPGHDNHLHVRFKE